MITIHDQIVVRACTSQHNTPPKTALYLTEPRSHSVLKKNYENTHAISTIHFYEYFLNFSEMFGFRPQFENEWSNGKTNNFDIKN